MLASTFALLAVGGPGHYPTKESINCSRPTRFGSTALFDNLGEQISKEQENPELERACTQGSTEADEIA
jgi:hypothetical protein